MALVIKYHRCWCWNVRMMIYITLRNVPIGMVDNYIIFFLRIDSQLRAPLQIYPAANIARKCTSPLTGWLPWDFCLFWDVWIDYNGQLIGSCRPCHHCILICYSVKFIDTQQMLSIWLLSPNKIDIIYILMSIHREEVNSVDIFWAQYGFK